MVQTFDEAPGSEPPGETAARLREMFTGYYALLRQLNDVEPEDPNCPTRRSGSPSRRRGDRVRPGREAAAPGGALHYPPGRGAVMLVPILTATVESALRIHRGPTPTAGAAAGPT